MKLSAELNDLSAEDTVILGKLEAFTCCVAALQKVDNASVTARLSLPSGGVYAATADRSGLIRGLREGNCDGKEATLEVTLQLSIRGTYTGVVTGTDFDDLVAGYFARSLQIASVCRIFADGDRYFCMTVEKLPGENCDLEEIGSLACARLSRETVPEEFVFLESSPLRFGCTCSRGALLRLVSALPPEDRRELSDETGRIVTHCNSCGKKYTFEV